MKAEYLNPFVASVVRITENLIGETPSRGKIFIREQWSNGCDKVAIVIGVAGMLAGQVVLSLPVESARNVASHLLKREIISEHDEHARSALAEIANMVTGNATIRLADMGCYCDITPPTIISGGGLSLAYPGDIKTIVIPLEFSMGCIDLNLTLRENMDSDGQREL